MPPEKPATNRTCHLLPRPAVGLWPGHLLSNCIDRVGNGYERLDVTVFKVDADPVQPAHPAYASQVYLYGHLLAITSVAGTQPLRGLLLFAGLAPNRWPNA